jgi:hypothetical protein
MRDSSMFYFNIAINYCAGCKYSPHPWLALAHHGGGAAEGDRRVTCLGLHATL